MNTTRDPAAIRRWVINGAGLLALLAVCVGVGVGLAMTVNSQSLGRTPSTPMTRFTPASEPVVSGSR